VIVTRFRLFFCFDLGIDLLWLRNGQEHGFYFVEFAVRQILHAAVISDVETLSNPGPVVQDNFELTDSLLYKGTGSPEGVVTAPIGSFYRNLSGGAGTTLYVKESGAGSTGWAAK
jgi:hypothetical protein